MRVTHVGDSQRMPNHDSPLPIGPEGEVMATTIQLRNDFAAQDLRGLAKRTDDAGHARRGFWRRRRYATAGQGDRRQLGASACLDREQDRRRFLAAAEHGHASGGQEPGADPKSGETDFVADQREHQMLRRSSAAEWSDLAAQHPYLALLRYRRRV